jgi:hypothetical protein
MTSTQTTPTVTTHERGSVQLGRTTYTVVDLTFSEYVDSISGAARPSSGETHLIGPRGARYLLRGFLLRKDQVDDGVRQVISLGSGQPLRVRGNEVRVLALGDVIEVL